MTDDILMLAHGAIILAIPFLLGVCAGIEIKKRVTEAVRNEEEKLGRQVSEIFAGMSDTLKFTGDGMQITRHGDFVRNGLQCRVTFTAHNVEGAA